MNSANCKNSKQKRRGMVGVLALKEVTKEATADLQTVQRLDQQKLYVMYLGYHTKMNGSQSLNDVEFCDHL